MCVLHYPLPDFKALAAVRQITNRMVLRVNAPAPVQTIKHLDVYWSTSTFTIPVCLANGDTTYNYQLGLDLA